jgi:hypothetical protein
VDHFHTCFVLKALAKIDQLNPNAACQDAIGRGVDYYLKNLVDEHGLPKPFSKAPRMTVYRRELYDFAECINLCLLLRDRFPQLQTVLHSVVNDVLVVGSRMGRSALAALGWVGQCANRRWDVQMFRSLSLFTL